MCVCVTQIIPSCLHVLSNVNITSNLDHPCFLSQKINSFSPLCDLFHHGVVYMLEAIFHTANMNSKHTGTKHTLDMRRTNVQTAF